MCVNATIDFHLYSIECECEALILASVNTSKYTLVLVQIYAHHTLMPHYSKSINYFCVCAIVVLRFDAMNHGTVWSDEEFYVEHTRFRIALFPGLPTIQFLIVSSVQKLEVIKKWMPGTRIICSTCSRSRILPQCLVSFSLIMLNSIKGADFCSDCKSLCVTTWLQGCDKVVTTWSEGCPNPGIVTPASRFLVVTRWSQGCK